MKTKKSTKSLSGELASLEKRLTALQESIDQHSKLFESISKQLLKPETRFTLLAETAKINTLEKILVGRGILKKSEIDNNFFDMLWDDVSIKLMGFDLSEEELRQRVPEILDGGMEL